MKGDLLQMHEKLEIKPPYTEDDFKEETRRIRRLRILVDFTLALIAQSDMPIEEAHKLVSAVRQQAMSLFPGKEEAFDLIYKPRFKRLIVERYSLQ
jgi:hypothetical protein